MSRFFATTIVLICLMYAGTASTTSIAFDTHDIIAKEGVEYEGVRYPAGSIITLYDATKTVASVVLSQDFKMNKQTIKAGTELVIKFGKLLCYSSLENQEIGIIKPGEGSDVCFDDNENIASIHLTKDTKIAGYTYKMGSTVRFHSNGNIEEGTLAKNTRKNGLFLRANTIIVFYASGQIKFGSLEKESRFNNMLLTKNKNNASGLDVEFWSNGKLKIGILAKKMRIDGLNCIPGEIEFQETGRLAACSITQRSQ